MLKVLTFTSRMPGSSRDEFERYWMDIHVPMWAAIEGISGYVVSRIASDHKRGDVPSIEMSGVDGIVEIWYADEATMARSAGSAAGLAWRADSAKFIGGMRSFLTREQAVVPLPVGSRPRFKALSIVARPEGVEKPRFLDYWAGHHAPMAGEVPGIRGFVLSHPLRELVRSDIPPIAMSRAPDGFTASYFDSLDARQAMVQSPEAKRWFADGASFLGSVRTFVVEETVVHAPPAAETRTQ